MDYQRVRLGTGDFILPLESELHFVLRDGEETNSPSSSPAPIPDGMFVFLALTKHIDTDKAAAGDVISAAVTKPVLNPSRSLSSFRRAPLSAAGSLAWNTGLCPPRIS